MHFGTHDQLILLALLAVLAALLIAAPKLRIPYPIFLVLGGLALGFVPGMPSLALPPDVVLVAVLPPLLYLSAYRTSLRDLRTNARAIGILAIGLVVATTVTVDKLAPTETAEMVAAEQQAVVRKVLHERLGLRSSRITPALVDHGPKPVTSRRSRTAVVRS